MSHRESPTSLACRRFLGESGMDGSYSGGTGFEFPGGEVRSGVPVIDGLHSPVIMVRGQERQSDRDGGIAAAIPEMGRQQFPCEGIGSWGKIPEFGMVLRSKPEIIGEAGRRGEIVG